VRHRIRVEKSFAFEKADKGGWRAGISMALQEVIEAMSELLRRFPNVE